VKPPLHVLMVEDSEDDARLVLRELDRGGYDVTSTRVELAEDFRRALEGGTWDLILSDYSLPHFGGEGALQILRETGRDIPFIFVSGTMGEDVAVAALKSGAHDYVMKNNLTRLVGAIGRELHDAIDRRLHREAESQLRMSEHKYRHLFRSMSDAALLIAEENDRIIDANEQAEILFGQSRDQILGQASARLFPPLEAGPPRKTDDNGSNRADSFGRETVAQRKDGGLIPVQVCVSRIKLSERPFLLALFRDITERKQTETALKNVMIHAHTMLMRLRVEAPAGWEQQSTEWAAANFRWDSLPFDETAAQRVLPLDVPAGRTYYQSWNHAKHPDDKRSMGLVAHQALLSGAPSWQQEFRAVDRLGRSHWFTQAASIEPVGLGRWHVTTINTDITERKQAEAAVRTSEERLSTVFHLSPTPIAIVRAADNRFVDVNETFCRGTGYTRAEIIGSTPDILHLWADPEERAAFMREVKEKGVVIARKLHGRRKSGEIGVGLGSMTRIPLNGEVHLLWLILDITEQERAGEAQRESEQRFRQVTENIDEVFWLTDLAKDEIIYVSPAYQCVWGRTCESLYANPNSWLDAVHPDDQDRVHSATITRGVTNGYDLEYRIVRPDGNVRWIHDRAFPIRDADDRVYRIAGVAADITTRHNLEDQLRHAQKMESLGTLAGGIAHDFNNILTGVLGSAEVARLVIPADHPAASWLDNIALAGNRARELVQQILMFGRKHESEMAPRKLQIVASEALKLLRTSIPSMVQIDSHIDMSCPPVIADDTQIHQVVMNLCTNAWHALPEQGGRIEVRLVPKEVTSEMAAKHLGLAAGAYVLLTVRDNGRGMPPEVQARIFEPFFTTKKQGQGTGLGLAVVHGIVQGHQGAIFVESVPEQGTLFEVYLPALTSPDSGGVVPTTPEALVRGHGENILLVDDDATALSGLRVQLEHLGYRATCVSDPRIALDRFLAQPGKFALLVTDYAMPNMSGQELAAKVMAARPDFPVILVSGLIELRQMQRAKELGIREMVRKPISVSELGRLLGRHLRPEKTS
jgi:two-component system cell cycle sensor histidine kinase/response regulator CckA